MRKSLSVLLAVLIVLLASGCSRQNLVTEDGVPCGGDGMGNCFFYVEDDIPLPCTAASYDLCSNTKGGFYRITGGKTYLCKKDDRNCYGMTEVAPPVDCSTQVTYDKVVDRGTAWKVISTDHGKNTTSETAMLTLHSSSTKAVEVSLEVEANVSLPVAGILAAIRAGLKVDVQQTTTTTVGSSFQMSVPGGQTGYGLYGVEMQVSEGRLVSFQPCLKKTTDHGTVRTHAPLAAGWCIYIAGQESRCPILKP